MSCIVSSKVLDVDTDRVPGGLDGWVSVRCDVKILVDARDDCVRGLIVAGFAERIKEEALEV